MTKQIRGKMEVIVITSVPCQYGNTFSRLVGKPIPAKQTGFGGWHISVAHDAITNPDSIWSKSDITTLFLNEMYARPATEEDVLVSKQALTGIIAREIGNAIKNYIRATSRDNPFRHWNRIKGNRKLGLPEVYTTKELRA